MQLQPSQTQCTHQLSWPCRSARSLHGLEGTGSHDLKQGIPCNLSLWLESLALTQCVCPKNDEWMTLFVWMKWGRLWLVVRGGRPWWNSATRSECLFVQNLTLNIVSHDELLPLWLSIFYSIHCQTFRIRAVRCFAILSDFPKKKRYALECGLRIVILEAVLNCVH